MANDNGEISIRTGALAGPLKALSWQVGPQARPLTDMGLSPKLLSSPEMPVTIDIFLEVLDRSTHLAADPRFPLRAGYALDIADFGLAGQAMLSAETLWDALSILEKGITYVQSNSNLEIRYPKGRCQIFYLNWANGDKYTFQDIEYSVGVISNIVNLALHKIDPEISIYYPNADRFHRNGLLANIDEFSSTVGIVEFDRRALLSKMPAGNQDRSAVLENLMSSAQIEDSFEWSLEKTVEQLVRASIGNCRPTKSVTAALLGINEKALTRALNAEGTTFRRILERAQMEIAENDLLVGKSVTETAFKLGYEHPQNFTTAFHKWFGSAPSSVKTTTKKYEPS